MLALGLRGGSAWGWGIKSPYLFKNHEYPPKPPFIFEKK